MSRILLFPEELMKPAIGVLKDARRLRNMTQATVAVKTSLYVRKLESMPEPTVLANADMKKWAKTVGIPTLSMLVNLAKARMEKGEPYSRLSGNGHGGLERIANRNAVIVAAAKAGIPMPWIANGLCLSRSCVYSVLKPPKVRKRLEHGNLYEEVAKELGVPNFRFPDRSGTKLPK